MLFNTKKPFDRRVLEGVVLTAAMNMQSEPATSGNHQQIPERLKVGMHAAVYPSVIIYVVKQVLIDEASQGVNARSGLPWKTSTQEMQRMRALVYSCVIYLCDEADS